MFSFISVVHELLFPILIHINERLTPAKVLTWDITLALDVTEVNRYGVNIILFSTCTSIKEISHFEGCQNKILTLWVAFGSGMRLGESHIIKN